MTFVVTDACIRCKYMDCVSACPTDCFREGLNMLVIEPDDCVDCGACWGRCPARAIAADSEEVAEPWVEHNRHYARQWPMVARKDGQTPADADKFRDLPNKFERYFMPDAGPGNFPDFGFLATDGGNSGSGGTLI